MKARNCDRCGEPARRYLYGDYCDEHAKPVPVPDPERTLAAMRAAHGILAVGTLDVTSSLNDQRAIASGRRRASLAAYRLARQAEDERRAAP